MARKSVFDASVPVSADGATGVWWRESFPSRKIASGWTVLDIRQPDLRPRTWLPVALSEPGYLRRRIALVRAFPGRVYINLTTWAGDTQAAIDVRASLSPAAWAGLIAAMEAQAPDAAHPVTVAVLDLGAGSSRVRLRDFTVLLPPARPATP